MENLTLSDTSVPEAAVYEACRIAGADAFIRALPQGYHTGLSGSGGGAGTHLSARQQQLLALARALAGRPCELLVDQATAAHGKGSAVAFPGALLGSVLATGCGELTGAHC